MKTFRLFALALVVPGTAMAGGYGPEFLPKDRPAPAGVSLTDKELLARQQERPFGGFVPADFTRETFDPLTMSEFISFGSHTAIVPKGAILHLPESAASTVSTSIHGELLAWSAFLARYRAKIVPLEVTLEQASGATPIEEAKLEPARRSQTIVVAVLHGNPISVHPAPTVKKSEAGDTQPILP